VGSRASESRSLLSGWTLAMALVMAPQSPSTPQIPWVLQLTPLISQAVQVLDVARIDRRLLVLDAEGLTLFDAADRGWTRLASRPMRQSSSRPRDLRGRLRVEGRSVDAFLPGLTCRGSLEPLAVNCVEGSSAWPIAIENTGVVSGRNYFAVRDGVHFLGVAPLERGDDARWIAATLDEQIVLMDNNGRINARLGAGDDVVRVSTTCACGSYVVVPATGSFDALRLYRVDSQQLVEVTPPAVVSGPVTALWTSASGALVVSRNRSTGFYEAFQVDVSCGR
jgi:hypothetical protein